MAIRFKTNPKPLPDLLVATEPRIKAIYVSTYIPRECGIATFTKNLTNSINILNPNFLADIVAIDDEDIGGKKKDYPWEVKYKIQQGDLRSWINAADYINQSGAEMVNIQHEFGIFGGHKGEYIVPFIETIKKPITITFHTVISKPDQDYLNIVSRIAERVEAIVVMVDYARQTLIKTYNVNPNKIVIIPHGVPDIPFSPTEPAKKELGLTGKTIVASFGLVNRGKGYEMAIRAMPDVLRKHPDTKLLLIGQTHPVVMRHEGEQYRQFLKDTVKELNLTKHVKFINRYLSIDELVDYLKAIDIYVTPYPNMEQMTSGTLAYAIGAGKPCVSTPYIYAQEVCKDDRGILVPWGDSNQLAKILNDLISHPVKRQRLAKKAYDYGRNTIWPSVALRYLDLFKIIVKNDCCHS